MSKDAMWLTTLILALNQFAKVIEGERREEYAEKCNEKCIKGDFMKVLQQNSKPLYFKCLNMDL